MTTITLPGTLHPKTSINLLNASTLLIKDDKTSLLLTISQDDQLLLLAANKNDIPEAPPSHLLAAALDFIFSKNHQLHAIHIAPELTASSAIAINYRAGFYQDKTLWHCRGTNDVTPEIWTQTNGVDHPLRPKQPEGVVYERYDFQNDVTVSFRTINPEQDLALFHQWMNQPRVAEFWEMAQSQSELQEYLHTLLQDPRTWPLIGCFNDEPFGYFELYWAMEDRIAPYYDCQPWDRGFHLLVGNSNFLGKRFSNSWTKAITHFLYLDDPRTARLVGEPRADNRRLLKLLAPAGWSVVKEFDFPHKRASLVNSHRRTFFQEVQL